MLRRSRRQYAPGTTRNRASPPRAGSPRQRTPYGASLSFATTAHLRLLSDPPSRKPASAKPRHQPAARSIPGRALASSMLGSPCEGPRTGLPPPISTTCLAHPVRPTGSPPRRSARLPQGSIFDRRQGVNFRPALTARCLGKHSDRRRLDPRAWDMGRSGRRSTFLGRRRDQAGGNRRADDGRPRRRLPVLRLRIRAPLAGTVRRAYAARAF